MQICRNTDFVLKKLVSEHCRKDFDLVQLVLLNQQVNNFQEVVFVQNFFENFDRFFYTAVLLCTLFKKFFDKLVNKNDFLKIINL